MIPRTSRFKSKIFKIFWDDGSWTTLVFLGLEIACSLHDYLLYQEKHKSILFLYFPCLITEKSGWQSSWILVILIGWRVDLSSHALFVILLCYGSFLSSSHEVSCSVPSSHPLLLFFRASVQIWLNMLEIVDLLLVFVSSWEILLFLNTPSTRILFHILSSFVVPLLIHNNHIEIDWHIILQQYDTHCILHIFFH